MDNCGDSQDIRTAGREDTACKEVVLDVLLYHVDKSTLTTLELILNITAKFVYCLLESYRHFIQTNTTDYIQDEMKEILQQGSV